MSIKSVIRKSVESVDEELKDKANKALQEMKKIEKARKKDMHKLELPNGSIVYSTSKENLKLYQEIYGE